jgi:hypothetical protein
VKRSKNEISTLTRVPPARGAIWFSAAAVCGISCRDLQVPNVRNLDIKPYAISSLTTDTLATPRLSHHSETEGRLDVKYAVTQGSRAADLTSTRISPGRSRRAAGQLTRFTVLSREARLLPRKPGHLLLRRGVNQQRGVGTSAAASSAAAASDAPIMFYDRRNRLNEGRQVPLNVGGRLTGRAEAVQRRPAQHPRLGDEEQTGALATNFSAVRLKRDVAAAEQRRCVVHQPIEVHEVGPGANSFVRRRWHLRVSSRICKSTRNGRATDTERFDHARQHQLSRAHRF